jgi:hypothetical protein
VGGRHRHFPSTTTTTNNNNNNNNPIDLALYAAAVHTCLPPSIDRLIDSSFIAGTDTQHSTQLLLLLLLCVIALVCKQHSPNGLEEVGEARLRLAVRHPCTLLYVCVYVCMDVWIDLVLIHLLMHCELNAAWLGLLR